MSEEKNMRACADGYGVGAPFKVVMYNCAVCNKETSEPKTLMDKGMHRYVCSSQCMINYYK